MDGLVFLIGFMGCGKTYWGAKTATAVGMPFYDLDALIEARGQGTVREIFSAHGEDAFRDLEQQTLHGCLQYPAAVIATGGGTPCFFDNMDWMNRHGRTIYLKTPASVLAERLKHELHLRPLLARVSAHQLEEHIQNLLAHREPYYAQAGVVVEQKDENAATFEARLLAAIQG